MRQVASTMGLLLLMLAGCGDDTVKNPDSGTCIPSAGLDLPDPDFVDTNCDGIDGDIESSIFVAIDGSDSGDGTINAPFRTIQHAIDHAQSTSMSTILISEGVYEESVALINNIGLYGGYDQSSGWSRSSSATTKILSAGGSSAVVADGITSSVIAMMHLESSDAGIGESSIAVSFSSVSDVTLRNVEIVAGRGGDGAPGSTPTTSISDGLVGSQGNTAIRSTSAEQTNAGGAGGAARTPCGKGGNGSNSTFFGGLGTGGAHERHEATGECLNVSWSGAASGENGSAGANGLPGEPGVSMGAFNLDGAPVYLAANGGGDGTRGYNGEGGRGGSNGGGWSDCGGQVYLLPSTGGGGGSGGQGGYGGTGGDGGGASIGLLVVSSENVELIEVAIRTDNGGNGGTGGLGQDGAGGGTGGPGGGQTYLKCDPGGVSQSNMPAGQKGGDGGAGGLGGQGGGGGGGPAIGIAYFGTQPIIGSSEISVGLGGEGGASEAQGANGESHETYEISL